MTAARVADGEIGATAAIHPNAALIVAPSLTEDAGAVYNTGYARTGYSIPS